MERPPAGEVCNPRTEGGVSDRRGHPGFYELLRRMEQLHDAKNHDYSSDADPLSNLRRAEAFGVPAWKGTLVRMSDKWSRIEQLASGDKTAAVQDEKLEDTLLDLATYCLLCIVLRQEGASK
jgi:hypothetical protein